MGAQLAQLAMNRPLWAAALGWFIAQLIKTLVALRKDKQLNLGHLVASGGMPSSHSALVVGLATAIGRVDGLASTVFALAAVFAGVVMYDAAGVRLAASRQARILNLMIDDFFHERGLREERLRELIGHTPIQVFAGAALGILVGILMTS
ncbi:MAG TPA: divergent PAP2 family protein [Ktedonobacterales bacterium]|nr:divergent PAP2 family protein [Ktedonobacterales bacterium]